MQDNPKDTKYPNKENNLSVLLSNYISVWLWSILLGGTTTLTYQIVNYSGYNKWGILSVSFASFTMFAVLLLVYSWFYLYKYLDKVIIPLVIMRKDPFEMECDRDEAAHILSRAYKYLIYAAVLGLSKSIFQHLFQALS